MLEAIKQGNISKIANFLKNGADANIKNKDGMPALHVAINSENLNVEQTIAVVNLLLEKGADINSKDALGNAALHHAAEFKDGLKILQHLVAHGARPTIRNTGGQTAKDVAKKNKRPDIEKWLFKQELVYRQNRTERRFFDTSRVKNSKKKTFQELSEKFRESRKNQNAEAIDVTAVSGRKLVMADGDALEHSVVFPDDPKDKAAFEKSLVEKGWYNAGYLKPEKKISKAWAWGKIKYLWQNKKFPDDEKTELVVSSQYQPLLGHQGNFRMAGIGDYGDKKGMVLDAIYEVTKKKSTDESEEEKEKNLAKLLLKCLRTGSPITTDLIFDNYLYFYSKDTKKVAKQMLRVTEQLNRVLLLTGIKEVTRRMHGSDITLPFATAYVQGLKLVSAGHLKMKDIFGKNASYGIPTASSLTTSHVASAAREKLEKLNTLFVEKLGKKGDEYSREYFHKLLRDEGYGGGDLTDGAAYETSEDEAAEEEKHYAP